MNTLNFGKKINDYSMALLNLALRILGFVVMDPLNNKRRSQLAFGLFYYIFTCIHYYFILMMFRGIEDISTLSRCLAALSTYSQTTLKMLPVIYFRNHIINMIERRKFFMKIDKENQQELNQEIARFYYKGYILSRNFFCLTSLTVLTFCIKPLLVKELLVIMWVPDIPYAYELILAGQYFYAPTLNCIIVGMDILYVSLCKDLTAQFKILGFNLLHLKENARLRHVTIKQELNRCIDHHVFLIKYAADMAKIYSIPLLGQYLITIGSICVDFFTVQDPTQPIGTRMASFMYTLSLCTQLSLYCFPATTLTAEISDMSQKYYSSGWESFSLDLQKSIYISIMLSQKEIVIKGGNFLTINRETFVAVFKTAFSFNTLMRSMN